MPEKKINITARETIKKINGRDCLLVCVELGPGNFPPRAVPYDVALDEVHAFIVTPSEDYTVLYAFFPLRIPQKGKLYYGYADGLEKHSVAFNFEKKRIELLDRKRIAGKIVEVNEFRDMLVK